MTQQYVIAVVEGRRIYGYLSTTGEVVKYQSQAEKFADKDSSDAKAKKSSAEMDMLDTMRLESIKAMS